MNVLAIETSTEYCSVAIWRDGTVSERFEQVGQKHSQVLMGMIDELLRDAGCTLQDMHGIAFGKGPGSFTGVRIACGVAQGLALGAALPVVGVNTLLAVAHASQKPRVIVALDARMAEVYFAVYEQRAGAWHARVEPCLCLPQDAPAVAGNDWHGAGSGFAVHGEVLAARYAGQLAEVDAQCVPRAAAIAELAAPQFADGNGMDAALAMPLYLRDKVALKTSERELL
ncbi:MAG TPA: tRNA (adenosine(37)-N6)-threonylcarbamoyltransferase complex dimerization subunit type 1 TsaB [Gallionellaceae bacterium]|nr:tRNA (adenosine(37)-N6)-threonylcarbamoyltransferase complex dimerization subunit type 1 TsaB [Gallionellaceae bacterium]